MNNPETQATWGTRNRPKTCKLKTAHSKLKKKDEQHGTHQKLMCQPIFSRRVNRSCFLCQS